MKRTLHKARIHLLIAGIISLFFSMIVFLFPAMPVLSLVWLFAAYMIGKGFALSGGAWQTRKEETHWLFLFWYGILNVITGITAFVYPDITIIILGFIVSINLFISGILQVMMAFHLHKEIKGTIWLLCSGLVAAIAGVYIYLLPRISTSTILSLIAVAALVVSLFLISLSLHSMNWHHADKKAVPAMEKK